MDLTEFLDSHGEDAPSGEDLEYDDASTALNVSGQVHAERRMGDSVLPARDPDHADVIVQAKDILSRSHDIRPAVYLAYTLLCTEGFPGFASATGLIRGFLEQWWDTVYPQLDADDDNDPTARVNAVTALADPDKFLQRIKTTPLTDSRNFGRMTLRDFAIAEGEIAAPEGAENVADETTLAAAMMDTDPDTLTTIYNGLKAAHDDVVAIGRVFDDHIPGYGPELEPLQKLLSQAMTRFANAGVGGAEPAEDAGDSADESDSSQPDMPRQTGPAGGGGGGNAAINNQNDVRNTIDRLIGYYARTEPSSPIPLILERAKRLVGADFMTIIKDMAPEGRDNVKLVGGLPDDDDD